MSRGARCLLWGVALVVLSVLGSVVLQGIFFAVLAGQRGIGPNAVMPALGLAGCFGVFLTVGFYGGIITLIVGIVLLVVDGSGPGHSYPRSYYQGPPGYAPLSWREVEDENRQLRAEVDRLRREREGTDNDQFWEGIMSDEEEHRRGE